MRHSIAWPVNVTSPCLNDSRSPAAIRICSLTMSMPVMNSVTGCSTWRRVFTSRKKKLPLSSSRNSNVPALVYCTARAASTTVPPSLRRIFSVTATDGAFLEQLLMAALDRALALAEVDDGAVMIAEHLELDVARALDVLLDVDVADAEGRFGLALRGLERLAQLRRGADDAHAAAAAAGHRLDDHREAEVPARS